jgi:hypothetical protein
LTGDLGLRPVKGPGFIGGRAAMINAAALRRCWEIRPTTCLWTEAPARAAAQGRNSRTAKYRQAQLTVLTRPSR